MLNATLRGGWAMGLLRRWRGTVRGREGGARRRILAAFLLGSLTAASSAYSQSIEPTARAAPAVPSLKITSDSACPAAGMIRGTIASLVPRGAVEALPSSTSVEVVDLGERYRVTLAVADGKERVRVYRDAARDCDQRARFVAVFIVLTLMPPELLADSPVKASPPPTPSPAPVPRVVAIAKLTPPRARAFRLEANATIDFAPPIADAPAIVSPGAEIRFSLGSRVLGLATGIGLQPTSSFSVGRLEARELRVPFDIGVTARVAAGPVEFGIEAGAVAAVFHAWGVNLAVPTGGTRVDLGARGAVALRLARPTTRFALVLGVHALYFPKAYEIVTLPSGVVGHTPSLWLGATAGASMSF